MEKAVIYARYSSDKQTEQSIEGQIRECTAFAKSQNLKIVGIYIDRATTGTNDKRAEFQRMLRDSAKKAFQYVIVYQLDRFSRNRYDSAVNKNTLKKNGVRVLSAKENITNDPAGIMLESMLEGMAEYFSAELALKVKRGMRETVLKGNFTGGGVTYGYRVFDKKYIIEPTAAAIVRRIYTEYASGSTVKSIIENLDKDGLKNTKGKSFPKNTVINILNNKKYIGTLTYGDLQIEEGIPAIVEKETFIKVANRMKKNKDYKGGGRATENYLLTGKLFCGKCETNMAGESGTSSSGTIYNYYKCQNQKRHKGSSCDKKTVNKNWLETFVVTETKKYILQDKTIMQIAHAIYVYNQKDVENNSTLIILNNQLKETNKGLDNLLKAIEQGIIAETTKSRMLDLECDKADLEAKIAYEMHKPTQLDEKQIRYWLQQFKDGNIEDVPFKERLIDTFINKIFLFDDRVIIIYNYNGDGSKLDITLTDIEKDLSDVRISPDWCTERFKGRTFVVTKDYFALEIIFNLC